MKKIYINDFGQKFVWTIKNQLTGAIYDLTGKSVEIVFYEQGTNTVLLTDDCVIDDATSGIVSWTSETGDFDTIGIYYTKFIITDDGSGDTITLTNEQFEILENNELIITFTEFKDWLNMPTNYMPKYSTVMTYLEEAETDVDTLMPSTVDTHSSDYIKIKKRLVKMGAAVLLFMNYDEGGLNPDLRSKKAELFTKKYNELLNSYLNRLGSTNGGTRKVVDTYEYNHWREIW